MNNFELAAKAKDIALNFKTLYVLGGFGAPATPSNKARWIKQYPYNSGYTRKKMIEAASADTFFFDCIGLIKGGCLWGWTGDKNDVYGGAKYCSNGVPDVGADYTITLCKGVSGDFSSIQVGEVVWLEGHIGVYIGNGLVVESSPRWGNGVQITACANIGMNKAYNARKWTKHGRLPWVKYVPAGDLDFDGKVTTKDARTALRGAVGSEKLNAAQIMAADLNGNGEIDTADARRILRKSIGLDGDEAK